MDDAARVAWGLPTAALVPMAVPHMRARSGGWTAAGSGAYALLTLAPLLPQLRSFALLAGTIAVALLLRHTLAPSRSGDPATAVRGAALTMPLLALVLAVAGAFVVDSHGSWDSIVNAVDDSEVIVVASGGLLAVFGGGLLVSELLTPSAEALATERRSQLANAGTYIGWCERAVFFAFIVAGEPQAAAVALAAKSFARFPSLAKGDEAFAEYFLIGTLLSVLVALAAAIGVRTAVGLPVL